MPALELIQAIFSSVFLKMSEKEAKNKIQDNGEYKHSIHDKVYSNIGFVFFIK
jgi:hypothetical protein